MAGLGSCRQTVAISIAVLASTACAPAVDAPNLTMRPPGRVQHALRMLDDLEASAQLVPRGGAPTPPTPLTRSTDGRSFSGRLDASPGEYTVEIVFTGTSTVLSGRLFLGRWTSDQVTVSLGQVTSTKFTTPLDTIGRPGDGGDEDGDGLGLLDELLWGADPTVADADGDGVNDGQDCDPDDRARAFVIVDGGSLEDCDGDGRRRPDVPYGTGGDDCRDDDPTIPRAEVCGDGVDQDCNPGTCPEELTGDMPPVFAVVTPPALTRVGCHSRVQVTLTDDTRVTSASARLPGNRFLPMTDGGGDQWTSAPFNLAAATDALPQGRQTVMLSATDSQGSTATHDLDLDFAIAAPMVTSMTPDSLPSGGSPFDVQVSAQATDAIATIQLMAAPRGAMGLYDGARAVSVGSADQGQATFRVDPNTLPDGEHLLYPIVTDVVGNVLQPDDLIAAVPVQGRFEIGADFRCLGTLTRFTLPARQLIAGATNPFQPAKMGELRAEAAMLAMASDPAARLVSIIGLAIRADGTIALDSTGFTPRWIFGYYNVAMDQHLTVTWLTAPNGRMNPVVDPTGSGATLEEPITSAIGGLVDSDVATAAFAASTNCGALTGHDSDLIQYIALGGQDVIQMSSNAGGFWRGTATAPVTELIGCQ